jgi:hypothetical protein
MNDLLQVAVDAHGGLSRWMAACGIASWSGRQFRGVLMSAIIRAGV